MAVLPLLAVGLLFSHVALASDQGHMIKNDTDLEIYARLELVEMDLSDACDSMTETQVNFWAGGKISVSSMVEADVKYVNVQREVSQLVPNETANASILRRIEMLRKPGDGLLNTGNYTAISKLKWEISDIMRHNQMEGKEGLATSRVAEELLKTWMQVEGSLEQFQERFLPNLHLLRTAAQANGAKDVESYWLQLSEYGGSYKEAEELWTKIEPLYSKLHGFVRNQLGLWYGDKQVPRNATIPTHLLGSLLGADWTSIADLLTADHGSYEQIQSTLQQLGYGGRTAYETGVGLVNSLGMQWSPSEEMWETSVLDAACPSHVFYYYESQSAVVVTCPEASWEQFVDAHEQMMSIAALPEQYEMLLKLGPRYSALLEALKGLASTLLSTPEYLRKIGLLVDQSKLRDLKATLLLLQAVHIVPRLPYYLAVDLWRLHVIEHNITEYKQAEEAWISFREKFQKVSPFLGSEESKTLSDILADPYVSSNKPYLSKFLGSILQFQILEKLFEFADTGGSDDRMKLIEKDGRFKNLMTVGTSQEWQMAIKDVLGVEAIDAGPLVRHFQPLESYLSTPIVKDKKYKPVPIKKPSAKMAPRKQTIPADGEKLEDVILTEVQHDRMQEELQEPVGDAARDAESASDDAETRGKDPPTTTLVAAFGVSALLAASAVVAAYVVGRRFYRGKFHYGAVKNNPQP